MKKLLNIGMMGVLVLFISFNHAYPQAESETLTKREAQAEIAPDSGSYVIGPEDVLYIHVWKEPTLTVTVPVRSDGKISLPLIDEIHAAGLRALQVKKIVTQRLKEYLDDPIVTVTVKEGNSHKVYVTGSVKLPGVYKISSETNLLQIIPMAGGFTEWANQKKILIIRKENGGEKRIIVNYKKIMDGKDPRSNITLKSGDTVIVP
jgi:polysaccharide export outer membrane protein